MDGNALAFLFWILNEDGPVRLAGREADDAEVAAGLDQGAGDAVPLQRGDGTVDGVAFAKPARVDGHTGGCKMKAVISDGNFAVIHARQYGV